MIPKTQATKEKNALIVQHQNLKIKNKPYTA